DQLMSTREGVMKIQQPKELGSYILFGSGQTGGGWVKSTPESIELKQRWEEAPTIKEQKRIYNLMRKKYQVSSFKQVVKLTFP
ncbi:unnamed protein product, partial [marine sediment metagenome]